MMFGRITEMTVEATVLIGVLKILQQIALILRRDSPTGHVLRRTIIQDWSFLRFLMGHLIFTVREVLILGVIHSS